MSVNFGNGYGMMNGMNMSGGMQGSGSNILSGINNQYNCPMCYQQDVLPYTYKTFVNPLPPAPTRVKTLLTRVFGRIFG